MKTHRLTVRGQLMSLNRERKVHRMPRSDAVRQWRSDAYLEAKVAHLPHLQRVCIIAAPFQHLHALADAGNHLPSIKAAIDGLVDAGVLDGDGPAHVRSLTLLAPKRTTQSSVDFVTLELVPVTSCDF